MLPQTLVDQPQASVDKFLLPMPKWPERESTLLRQLQKREGVDEDAAALQVRERGGGAECERDRGARPLSSSRLRGARPLSSSRLRCLTQPEEPLSSPLLLLPPSLPPTVPFPPSLPQSLSPPTTPIICPGGRGRDDERKVADGRPSGLRAAAPSRAGDQVGAIVRPPGGLHRSGQGRIRGQVGDGARSGMGLGR